MADEYSFGDEIKTRIMHEISTLEELEELGKTDEYHRLSAESKSSLLDHLALPNKRFNVRLNYFFQNIVKFIFSFQTESNFLTELNRKPNFLVQFVSAGLVRFITVGLEHG